MSTIHFRQRPQRRSCSRSLTDFRPPRSRVFGNSADEDLNVHSGSAYHFGVTEGSGGVSDPLRRRLGVVLGAWASASSKAFVNSVKAIGARRDAHPRPRVDL
jgi:hypothetical protein